MPAARVIVLEESQRWTIALRWALRGTAIQLQRSQSWQDCQKQLCESPSSLLLLELTGSVPDWLAGLADRYPASCWIALGLAGANDPWLARELGAAHVIRTTRNLAPTACIIQRHLGRPGSDALGLREQLWQRLPFG